MFTAAALFLGVVVGNAALFGDTLFATVTVPQSLTSIGLTQTTAERMFVTNVAHYLKVPSLLQTPSVTSSSAQNLPMAMAKPFNLQDVVYAIQTSVRSDSVNVSASIVNAEKGGGLLMYLLINNPPDPPTATVLHQPDGDPEALIAQAARRTMEIAAPFRVANSDMAAALSGDKTGMARAKATAIGGLAEPWDPRISGVTEVVMLHNLLAIIAMINGDKADAQNHCAVGLNTQGAEPAAYGLIWLNQAFFAIAERNTHEANRLYDKGSAAVRHVRSQGLQMRVLSLGGIIAWISGDLPEAERRFRSAIATGAGDSEPHRYLALLLTQQGNLAEAKQQQEIAALTRFADSRYPSLAHTYLSLDPAKPGFSHDF